MSKPAQTRQATEADFRVGAEVTNNYGTWKLLCEYMPGVWEARKYDGYRTQEKLIFQDEARFFTVPS